MADQSMDEEGPVDEYHPPISGAGIIDTTGNTDNAQLEPGHKPSPDQIRSHDDASLDEYAAVKEAVRVDDSAEIKNTRVQAKQLNSSSSSGVQEKLKTEVHSAKELEIMASREKDKGNEAFRAGDYSEAIKYYTRSLSVIASAPAYNNRAQARIRLEQFPSAVVDCNNVLELEPGNLKALLRRGLALKSLQQYKEAVADLEYVLNVEPENKHAKDLLDDVKRELNASISVSSDRKNPSDVLSSETTGDVVRTGDEGEQAPSKPLPEKALSSKPLPEKVVLLKDEGMQLYKAGQYDLAREKYTTALNILQQDQCSYQSAIASLYNNRSACRLNLGDCHMCISDCDASLKIYPHNVRVYVRRGKAYETLERYNHAYLDYQQALTMDHYDSTAQTSATRVAKVLRDQHGPTWTDELPSRTMISAPRISIPGDTQSKCISNTGTAAESGIITGTDTLAGGDGTTGDSNGGNGSSADGESGTSGNGINGNIATTVGGNAARAVVTNGTTTGNVIQAEPPTEKKPAVSTSVPVTQKPLSKEEQFQTLKSEGQDFVRKGKYKEATDCYTACADIEPGRAVSFTNRALCYLKLCQYEKAKDDCTRAIQLDPKNVKGFYRRALAEKGLGNYFESIKDLSTVHKLEPTNTFAKKELEIVKDIWQKNLSSKPLPEKVVLLKDEGMQLYKAGQYGLAREKYTTALNMLQQDQCYYQSAIASLYNNRSACQLKLGDCQVCISDCDASLKIYPHNVKAYLRRGKALEILERYNYAYLDYQQALTLNHYDSTAQTSATRVAKVLQDQHGPTWGDELPSQTMISAPRVSIPGDTPAQRLPNTDIAAEGSVITGTGTLPGGDGTTGDSNGGNGSSADGESGTSGNGINGNSATTVGGNAAHADGTDGTTTGNIMIQAEPPTKKKPAVSTSVPVTQKPLSKEEQFQKLKSEGNDFFTKGKYKEAIDCYTACDDMKPGRAVSFTNRALCYLKLCQYEKAKDDCTSAIQLNPKSVKGFYRRAMAEKGLGNNDAYTTDLTTGFKVLREKYKKSPNIPTESNEAPSKKKKKNVLFVEADSDSEEGKAQLEPGHRPSPDRIRSHDYASGYEYAADKEAVRVDNSAEIKNTRVQAKQLNSSSSSGVQEKLKTEGYSAKELEIMANREKDKGNANLPSKPLPEKVVLLTDEGMQLYKAGQYGHAREKYTTALNMLHQDQCSYQSAIASLYNNRSACQLKLGDCQVCISDCDASLKIYPHNVKVYLRRGKAYETLERYNYAYLDYQHALTLSHYDSTAQTSATRVAKVLQDQHGPTWGDELPSRTMISAPRVSIPGDTPAQRLSNTGIAAEGSVITGTGTGDGTTGDSNGSSADGESGTSGSGSGINDNSATTVGGNAAQADGPGGTTTGNIMIQAEPPTKKKPAVSTSVPVTQEPLSKEEQFQTLKSEGEDFFTKGEYKEAIDCYTACADMEPGRAVSFTNRALCYLKLCQYEKAKDDCTRAIQLDPKNVKGFYRRAQAEKGLGNYFESIKDLSTVLKLEPTNTFAKKELEIVKDTWRKELGGEQTKSTNIPTESNEAPSKKKRNVPIEGADSDSEEGKNENDYRDHVDVSQESESFMGMSKGFLLSQPDIPDVSPHCKRECFINDPEVLLQRLVRGKRTKEEDILESYLREQETYINVGGGSTEKLTIDAANKRYMSAHFKDLGKSAYCLPLVFDYKHPGEPFDVDEKSKVSPFPKRLVGIDTLCRERRGEHAEEQTVGAFSTMFSKYDIPSFIIHGYQWKTQYVDVLKKLTRKNNKPISKLLSRVYKKYGEMDLLISLPRKCLFVVEVKAVQDGQNWDKEIVRVVTKALLQCQNSADEFLSKIAEWSNPVSLIKVVVLPNCTRPTVDRLFCMICRTHVISADELSSVSKLNSWFQRITDQYSAQIESSPLQLSAHLELIGRLIGSASMNGPNTIMRSIERTVEQINKHGGSEKVKEKIMAWDQMTPQQLSAKWRDAKFLIVFGPPGSGKTLLALSKAKELLESGRDDVLYIVCNEWSHGLKDMYKVELGKVKVADDKPRKPRFFVCDFNAEEVIPHTTYLSDCIDTLKKGHTGKTVHVICDELMCTPQWVNPLVGIEGVGYVWLLMDPYFSTHIRSIHGFEVICLDWVMRMSRQNIAFANAFFSRFRDTLRVYVPELRAGHGVNGVRPVVYRMKCVCQESRVEHNSPRCTYIRINWMIIKAYHDLGTDLLKCPNLDGALLPLSLISPHSVTLNKLAFLKFHTNRGCESQLVIMDIMDLLNYYQSFVGLTRSLGKVIILDGGCSDMKMVAEYDDFITMITENPSIVEVKEVHPSDEDLLLMYQGRILTIGLKVMERSLYHELFEQDP